MKIKRLHIFAAFMLTLLCSMISCSTKKNTALTRGYQAMTTRFNVYHNGKEALKKGTQRIEDAYKPDYTRTLVMYPVSDKTTLGAAKGDAQKAVEKCEKAIKLHSIRKKPVKKLGKMKDPKYAAFYAQEEFNPMMDDVWMLMGKAKYYANDYLAASATFSYVQNHFKTDEDLVVMATLWKARAYKELGWIYEAEEQITSIDEDKISYKTEAFYHSTLADLKLVQGEKRDALPHLLAAIPEAESRTERARFYFIAGQIYQELGDKEMAYAYYDTVLRSCPIYEMEFNARIRQTEVFSAVNGNPTSVIKSLEKLAKSEKNKDYLDQIYYAIANVYLNGKDTANAVKNYHLAAEKSTRGGVEKAQALVTLGRLYWGSKRYVEAEPCYSDAASEMSHEHPDYSEVSSRSLKLSELKQNYDIVHLQDSLLALADAPKTEQIAAARREIAKIEAEERAEREREADRIREEKLLELEIEKMQSQNVASSKGSTWYFFNPSTVSKGKLEFQKKFGSRKLEDNWNRRTKTLSNFSDDALADATEEETVVSRDSAAAVDSSVAVASNVSNKNPEYYLRQLPTTAEQKEVALSQVEQALWNEALIYSEKIEDYPVALATFEEYIRRFGNRGKGADAHFYCYRVANLMNNTEAQQRHKDSLTANYTESKYAQILNNPDYQRRLLALKHVEDSVYAATYSAYLASNYSAVYVNTAYMEQNYRMSNLMPKFQMLKALSLGKQGKQEDLQTELKQIIADYPNSDITPMAKGIIALIEQGGVTQSGTTATLAQSREEQLLMEETTAGVEISKDGFTYNANTPYHFYIITDPAEVDQNQLLFNVATYNFSKFLVKDFDLKIRPGIVSVSGLENIDEALWYAKGVNEDQALMSQLQGKKHTLLVISDENSALIGRGYTIDLYEEFYRDSVLNRKHETKKAKINLVGEQKELDKIAKESSKINVKEGQDLNGVKTTVGTKSEEPATTTQANAPSNETSSITAADTSVTAQANEPTTLPQANTDESEKHKKELKKYKGLYTFDKSAKHYFAILVAKGAINADTVVRMLEEWNKENASLYNLKVEKSDGRNLPVIITVGMMENSTVALDYLKQMVVNEQLKKLLTDIVYKNVIITKDNLDALKTSGNINVYMELFKRGYIGR